MTSIASTALPVSLTDKALIDRILLHDFGVNPSSIQCVFRSPMSELRKESEYDVYVGTARTYADVYRVNIDTLSGKRRGAFFGDIDFLMMAVLRPVDIS